MNRDELRKRAAELKILGRSKMTTDELRDAIEAAETVDWENEGGAPPGEHLMWNRSQEANRRQGRGW